MPPQAVTQRAQEKAPARDGSVARTVRPIGRFVLHYIEMCAVMCIGALVLSVLFFGAAGLFGYTDMPRQFPELSVLVIAINLSVPMAAWMRFRGMDWRPTVEMAGSTMVVGLLLIAAYWLGIVAKGSLVDVQTSLACPVMLAVMSVRFPLYSAHQGHRVHRSNTGNPRDGAPHCWGHVSTLPRSPRLNDVVPAPALRPGQTDHRPRRHLSCLQSGEGGVPGKSSSSWRSGCWNSGLRDDPENLRRIESRAG